MAKGGSRFGAGRPSYKVKAELALALDIRALKREGCLDRSFPFSWVWHTNHGDKVGSATIKVADEQLRLSYAWVFFAFYGITVKQISWIISYIFLTL